MKRQSGTGWRGCLAACSSDRGVYRPTLSGLVRVSKAGPGVLVGLRAMFDETHHLGSALIAEQAAQVRLLPMALLQRWQHQDPQSDIAFQEGMLRGRHQPL
ncbi:hypothetical protein Mmc1_1713 [Magnetococcus marinus MC-1]|uniref:Uncharacterized protein n=1 Tax=Magnetococcus marinus (strain ATCC BAA-1437 / JCM 17883 / MC-1) TaxID=156889 RepID=A0L8C9_MAGMM|nr:hypothetical protein [Magnetococcus marinus]ABK44222.1 hypothetical protein Mmc1_1713 [Magnetococcus marinus MC-1]